MLLYKDIIGIQFYMRKHYSDTFIYTIHLMGQYFLYENIIQIKLFILKHYPNNIFNMQILSSIYYYT